MSGALQAVFQNQRSFGLPSFISYIVPASGNFFPGPPQSWLAANNDSVYIAGVRETPLGGAIQKLSIGTGLLTPQYVVTAGSTFNYAVLHRDATHVYAAGRINISSNRLCITKYTLDLDVTWSRETGSNSVFYNAIGIATDASGGVYALATKQASAPNRTKILKLNSSGNLQWNKEYGDTATNTPLGISNNNTNSYVVLRYLPDGQAHFGVLLIINNSTGNLVSQHRYPDSMIFSTVAVAASGNVYVGAATSGSNSSIVKLNSSGVKQWGRQLETGPADIAVAVDSSENVYGVVGFNRDDAVKTVLIRKIDSAGTLQWVRTLKLNFSTSNDPPDALSIAVQNDGQYSIGGQIRVGTKYSPFIAVFKTDGSGVGTYSIGGSTAVYAVGSAVATNDNNVFSTPTFPYQNALNTAVMASVSLSQTSTTDSLERVVL